jgi:hypothetical protein
MVEAVSLVLQSGVPLEIIEMEKVSMPGDGMKHLLSGLEACPSLTELSLDGVFEGEADASFVRRLCAKRASTAYGIHRLCLANGSRWTFPFTLLLTGLKPASTSTGTPSSLQCLKLLSQFDDICKMLSALVKGHRLPTWSLGCLTDNSW